MVATAYDKFKKSSQIIFDGNPSTASPKQIKLVDINPSSHRHDELYKHYQEKQQKIKELQEIKAQNDMIPYTFTPNLSLTQKKKNKQMKQFDN